MDPVTVQLSQPVRRGSETITEVTIRELRLRDLRQIDSVKGDIARTAKLLSLVTGLTDRELDDLPARDLKTLGEALSAFF